MLLSGAKLGPYEIVSPIGAGGMGEVYRAVDPRLGREVAIKVLRVGLDEAALARFQREARAIAALSHPNTLAIFDLGEEAGRPYLVTELLAGETLRARLTRGALPLGDALGITLQILDALAATHEKGIVHRDLKPENVFLLPGGVVKLLDFGLATRVASVGSEDGSATLATTFATTAGTFMGTIGYTAPEQARGLECDGRADIFSLGAVLYEMLAGTRPFVGGSSIDTLVAILSTDAPAFPERASVSRSLDGIVRRMLAREPEARFQSARDVTSALDALPGAGNEPPSTQTTETSLAILPFADLSPGRDHDYFCEGMAEEILGGLAHVAGLRVAAASASFRFRGRDIDLREVASTLKVDSILEGSVRAAGSRLRVAVRLTGVPDGHVVWSEQFDRDLSDVFAVQDEIARTVVTALRIRLAAPAASHLVRPPTASPEAYALYLKGRFHWNKRTDADLVEAVEWFRQALAIDRRFARAAAGMADAFATIGVYGLRAPDDVMAKAKAAALEAVQEDDRLADAYATLGTIRALYDWSWADADADFRRAVALDPTYATGLQWYAVHGLLPLGRFEEARAMLTRALTADPVSLPINASQGLLHYMEGRSADAVGVLEHTLALDPRFFPGHLFLGYALSDLGDHQRSLAHLESAYALSPTPEAEAALGFAHGRAGNASRARDALARLEATSATRYVSPVLSAHVHIALGDRNGALHELERATEVRAADLAWIGVRPVFQPLRGYERFEALARRLGLRPFHAR